MEGGSSKEEGVFCVYLFFCDDLGFLDIILGTATISSFTFRGKRRSVIKKGASAPKIFAEKG
jgi:hypothetical protein